MEGTLFDNKSTMQSERKDSESWYEEGLSLLNDKTKVVAVCSAGINMDYNDELLKHLYSLADEYGFKILFFNSFSSLYHVEKHDLGESNIFQLINYRMIDGVILLAETIKNDEIRNAIVKEVQAQNIPIVSIDHYIEGCYNINFKYRKAVEEIVTHLIEEHGYRTINFIAGIKDNSFSDERIQAYKDVLKKYDIPVEEERIGYGCFWSGPTKDVIEDFIKSDLPFPDAIVCANDCMAIAAIKYLTQAGYRVPEDVAVTGFDGILEGQEHIPRITTAKNNYEQTIRYAYQIISDCIAKKKPPKQMFVDAEMLIGDSCGCKKSEGKQYNNDLTRNLYDRMGEFESFSRMQISMAAELTDNDSFQGIFDNLMKYSENFYASKFWLCIVDDFLMQKEALTDIIEESGIKRSGYSSVMNAMLSKSDDEWLGIIDFNTASLLPKLEEVLETENNIMFFPLHVLERTIGYVAVVYKPEQMKMVFAYQFLMNISNALETTKIHQIQKTIINSLEVKYIHDPMTGLYNRRGFYQCLNQVYEECVNDGKRLMVVSVDLNGLKQINDTYGHADGDIAISTVGRALAEVSSGKYTCARFGGDEFVVAGMVESDEEAGKFCADVAVYLDDFNANSGKPYKVGSSIGNVVGIPTGQISLDEFIKVADEKMYEDKVRYHSRSR